MHLFEYEIFKVLKKWKFLLIAFYSQIWIIQLYAHWDTCVTITLLYITNYWINPVWLPFGYHLEGKRGGGLSQKQTAANGDGGQPNVDVRSGKNYFHFFTIISK